jgi:hypothetical protein
MPVTISALYRKLGFLPQITHLEEIIAWSDRGLQLLNDQTILDNERFS